MADYCNKCGAELTVDNWYKSNIEKKYYICNSCSNCRSSEWRKNNPERSTEIRKKSERVRGIMSFDENKECALFLGVHIAEGVLRRVFKDVDRMHMGNPGFDFICNSGKKVDVKSSCINKRGHWHFNICRNTCPDYFLCLAFDNREDLNPLHCWLFPGYEFNHLQALTPRPGMVSKWTEYEIDISKVVDCCDTMKKE